MELKLTEEFFKLSVPWTWDQCTS